MKLKRLYFGTFNDDITSFMAEATAVKFELFRASYQKRKVNDVKVQRCIGKLNGLLAKYGNSLEEAESVAKKTGKIDTSKSCYATPYSDIKDVLYAKYDYAAILQFVDGLYKGIDSGKFSEDDDFDEFFKHTANMAFKGLPDSTAAIVDATNDINEQKSDTAEISHYNAVIGQKIYNSRDREELYKAATKTLDFLCDKINTENDFGLDTDNMSVQVLFVNNIIEFITYSLAAYMYKAFILSGYIESYVDHAIEDNGPIAESVQEVSNKISDLDVTIMKTADDALCREPKDLQNLYNVLNEFAQIIGSEIFKNQKDFASTDALPNSVDCDAENDSNIFREKLIGNSLYEFIFNKLGHIYSNYDSSANAAALSDELSSLLHNNQGLSTTVSPKQELVTILRDTWNDKTSEDDLRKITKDLGVCGIGLLAFIKDIFMDTIRRYRIEINDPTKNNAYLTALAEISKACKELYIELANVIMSRFREIEVQYNKNRTAKIADGFAELSIKVPGNFKDNDPAKEVMGDAVPDTTRSELELYGRPTYESLRMYAEYASTILPDSEYYSEAVDFSKIMDAIQAFVSAWFKKAVQFFDNSKLKEASEWVTANKTMLMNGTYNGNMEVLPYRADIKYPDIDKFADKLNNGFRDIVYSSQKNLDAFITNLYHAEDPKLTELWRSDDKNAPKQLENYILFGANPETEVKSKSISNNDIKKNMATWISTVESASAVREKFINSEKKADNAMKAMKLKVADKKSYTDENKEQNAVQAQQTQQTPPANNQQQAAQQTAQQNNQQNNQQNAQQNQQTEQNGESLVQSAVTQIQTAYQKIVFPSYSIFRRAIIDQYNYIKQAYNLMNK